MKFAKIVLTGGPCAGKTTAICKVEEYFTSLGYKVFVLQETASELINDGTTKNLFSSALEFQKKIFAMQIAKETLIGEDALSCGEDKVLLICDRGIPDNAAYLSASDYYRLLQINNTTKTEALLRYDAVFHLQTIAKKSPQKYYEMIKNSIRVESYQKACEIDDTLLFTWEDHPHYFYFEAEETLDKKINKLILSIADYLQEDPIVQREKYIINSTFPDSIFSRVWNVDGYRTNDDQTAFIIEENGKKLFKLRGVDSEEYISTKKFIELAGNVTSYIRKFSFKRYAAKYNDSFMFVDHFDKQDNALLTVLKTSDEETILPEGFKVIKKID